MFKGFRYFMRYCWKQQKSYILYLLLGEVFQTVVFVSGIIFPKFIIDFLFEEREISKAIIYAAVFLILLFFSNIMLALSKYRAERNRDQMYRKFSISYAQQVMESDYCNMENPEYMDLRENALKCMTGDYGFAGIVFLFVNLFGKLLLIGSIITIVMTLDVVMLLICALLIAVDVWINNHMGKKNAQIDLESVLEKRKADYYHQLGDDTCFAKEIRLNGLHNWILDLYREQFIRVHQFTKKRNANTCKGVIVGRVSTFLQQCTAYGYLIYKVLRTGLSMGGFTMYLNAILSFNASITELLIIIGRLRQCSIYLKPFEEFMNYHSQSDSGIVRRVSPHKQFSGALSGDEIHCLRRLRRDVLSRLSWSWQLARRSVAAFVGGCPPHDAVTGGSPIVTGGKQPCSDKISENLKETVGIVPLEKDITDYCLRFEHVYFRYPGQEQFVLRDVSCEIHSCEKVAVVGENGAGKSTFVKLLTRLYDPTEGCIYLNDRDIRTIDYQEYIKLFSVVFQDYMLFAMTIKENIGLDQSDLIGEQELNALADSIGLKKKIDELTQGFDTSVYKTFDDKGFEPSGGEGQKIAIARAYIKKAPVVILDEPTAALDPRTEYEIYQNFSKLSENKTAIHISHRLASCRICDQIFVFLNGSIVQRGTHEELITQEGYYAEIFKMQTALYCEEAGTNV